MCINVNAIILYFEYFGSTPESFLLPKKIGFCSPSTNKIMHTFVSNEAKYTLIVWHVEGLDSIQGHIRYFLCFEMFSFIPMPMYLFKCLKESLALLWTY